MDQYVVIESRKFPLKPHILNNMYMIIVQLSLQTEGTTDFSV